MTRLLLAAIFAAAVAGHASASWVFTTCPTLDCSGDSCSSMLVNDTGCTSAGNAMNWSIKTLSTTASQVIMEWYPLSTTCTGATPGQWTLLPDVCQAPRGMAMGVQASFACNNGSNGWLLTAYGNSSCAAGWNTFGDIIYASGGCTGGISFGGSILTTAANETTISASLYIEPNCNGSPYEQLVIPVGQCVNGSDVPFPFTAEYACPP